MTTILWVAAGGAIGASGRYLVGEASTRVFGHGLPYGTLIVNVLGGFAMGLLVVWLSMRAQGDQALRLFLGVGLLGGFTTFSAFSLEMMRFIETKLYAAALGYMTLSVGLSIGACALGLIIGRKVFAI